MRPDGFADSVADATTESTSDAATEPASDSAADTDANNSGPNTITNAKPDHVGQPAMLQQLGHGFWNEQVCHLRCFRRQL
jgi:hypothetical protein